MLSSAILHKFRFASESVMSHAFGIVYTFLSRDENLRGYGGCATPTTLKKIAASQGKNGSATYFAGQFTEPRTNAKLLLLNQLASDEKCFQGQL